MVLTNETTLGQVAAENPLAARVFEKYQLDYCCGGDRSIEQACREKGIPAERVLAELQQGGPPEPVKDWSSASQADLIGHIVGKHHAYLRAELPALETRMEKVAQAHGANHAGALRPLQETLHGLKTELATHMIKEEMILFPLIEQMEAAEKAGGPLAPAHCGSVNNPIRVMQYEHDSAGAALREMRMLTSDYAVPADGRNTFRALYQGLRELEADLHMHIHLENNVLFPRAAELETKLITL